MITSILYSSPSFEAVDYNERKVAKGDATLLVMENFGYLGETKDYTVNELRQYLMDYSAQNERIKKPQMHVAFSCRGQEMNNEELVAYARQWLGEMGYANTKQPLLIYAHKDTDNNHIHVITSRVDPEGKKIDHNHERVRSKAFVERTLGVDTAGELNRILQASLSYQFESIGQWQAVLESSGYYVGQEGELLKIAKNGTYQRTLKQQEIAHRLAKDYADKKCLQQLRALLRKYRDHACDKYELQELMKRKFGVDLVFFGGKDNPRGYFIVDHKQKAVYKGSSVLKIADLLTFEPHEEKLKRIDAFIDEKLEDNPRLTCVELNRLLRKHYSASYRNGVIHQINSSTRLLPYMSAAFMYNDKVDLLKTMNYSTQEELEAACAYFKVRGEDVSFAPRTIETHSLLEQAVQSISVSSTLQERKNYLQQQGLTLISHEGKFFLFEPQDRTICSLEDKGIKMNPEKVSEDSCTKQHPTSSITKQRAIVRGSSTRGSSANREWEVGTKGDYNDIDNERKLKR